MTKIVSSELLLKKAVNHNQTATGGGRMSEYIVLPNVAGTLFPEVDSATLAAGWDLFRKVFVHVDDGDNEAAKASRLYLFAPPGGDGRSYLTPATHEDMFGAFVPASADWYGVGLLDGAHLSGVTSIDVSVHDASVVIFRDGDLLRISEQTGHTDSVSAAAWARISGTPTLAGSVWTLPLAEPLGLDFADGARVSSVIEYGDVAASVSWSAVTSALGDFDDSLCLAYARGARRQVLTATFTGATSYTLTGDTWGDLGAGSTLTDKTVSFGGNLALEIPAGCWSGTWASGESVQITLDPAAMPAWVRFNGPANAAPVTATPYLVCHVESS